MPESRRMRRKYRTQTLAEGLLALTVAACPLALGGTWPEMFVVAAFAGALTLSAVAAGRANEGLPVPLLTWALGASVVLTLLSCLPLPSVLTGFLSPRAVELAVLPPETPPTFVPTSLDWPASLVDAARLAALVGVFLASSVLSRSDATARRLAMLLVGTGVACAIVAATHALVGAEAIYGLVRIHQDAPMSGPFVNPNQAASIGVLATTAAVGLWRDSTNQSVKAALVAAAATTTLYTFASESTGGIASLIVGVAIATSMGASSRHSGPQVVQWPVIAALVFAALAGVVALLLPERVDELLEGPGGKWAPWPKTLELIRDHWMTGVGRGAFSPAFEAYAPLRTVTHATHPENVVLQWLSEWGVPAGLAGLFFVARELWIGVRTSQAGDLGTLRTGLLAGVIAVFLHELADFGLEFLGVGVPTMAALGVVSAKTVGPARPSSKWGYAVAAAIALVGLVAGVTGLPRLARNELARVLPMADGPAAPLVAAYRDVRRRHPATALVCIRAAEELIPKAVGDARKDVLVEAMPFVGRALELTHRELVHRIAARAFLAAGRRNQALSELRAAFVVAPLLSEVVDEALAIGIDAPTLASMFRALAAALEEEHALPEQASDALAGTLHYVRADHHLDGLAWLTAVELLEEPSPQFPITEELAFSACQAAADDAYCHATRPACTSPTDMPAHGRFLLSIADRGPPGTERVAVCRAQGLLMLDRRAEAMDVMRSASERLPSATSIRVLYGQELLNEGSVDTAAVVLEAAATPREEYLVRRLAELRVTAFLAAGRSERAATEAARVVDAWPGRFWPYLVRARVQGAAGDDKGVEASLEKARSLASPAERPQVEAERERLKAEAAARPAR